MFSLRLYNLSTVQNLPWYSLKYSQILSEIRKKKWLFGARTYFRNENKLPILKIFTNFVMRSGYITTTSHVEIERFGSFLLFSILAVIFSKNIVSEFWGFMHAVQYGENIWYFDLYNLLSFSFQDGYISLLSADSLY